MLTDFSESNLSRLCYNRMYFLIQCKKTKVIFRMHIEKHENNKYYVSQSGSMRGGQSIFVHKNNYFSPYNGGTFVMENLVTLGGILKSKNFYVSKGTGRRYAI